MDAIEALRTRRSIRSYEDKPVPRDFIEQIVDCGRLAATARNEQPWEFVAVTDAETRARIAAAAVHGKHIAQAPVCIVVLGRSAADYYVTDGSAATQNILVAAQALGLGTCWVAGDRKPYAGAICEIIGAPDSYGLVSLVSVGYTKETPAPKKRALNEVLHWERF